MKIISRNLSRLCKVFSFFSEYAKDLWMFVRYNGHSPLVEYKTRLFYSTIIQAHTIEKGLALAKPRPLFGREKIASLLRKLRNHDPSDSSFPIDMTNGALSDYRAFNSAMGLEDPILEKIDDHLKKFSATPDVFTGGVKAVPLQSLGTENDYATSFLRLRTSCRMFKVDALPLKKVEKAVKTAQSAPSQCNRQASKAHFYQDREMICDLLNLQGGSAGFTDSIGNLFVITSEISAWGGPQQRNQLYIDGALFSLTLIYACYALGLGSCPLNLAVTNKIEKQIKLLGGIPKNERVIMMIAVGMVETEGLKAAKSPRRAISEILTVH